MKKEKYYFDMIIINTLYDVKELKKLLPEFKNKIYFPSHQAQQFHRFRSRTQLQAPKPFDLERIHDVLGDYFYRMTRLEIAKDTPYKTEGEAVAEANKMIESTYMKWARTHEHRDYVDPHEDEDYDHFNKRIEDNMKLGTFNNYTTGDYWGNKYFRYTLYPRLSKANGEPVVHEEFRILHSTEIRKKVGITNLKELAEADIKKLFGSLRDKYIRKVTIDHTKLGYWLSGDRKYANPIGKQYCNKRWDKKGRGKQRIVNLNGLIEQLKEIKEEIKEEIKWKAGRRTKLQNKFLGLKTYHKFGIWET